jgi:hypothetical protein
MKASIVGVSVLMMLAAPSAFADSCIGNTAAGSTNGDWSVSPQLDEQTGECRYVLTNSKTREKRTGPLPEIKGHVHLRFFVSKNGNRFAALNEKGGRQLADRLLIYDGDGTLVTSLGIQDILNKEEQAGIRISTSHIAWLKGEGEYVAGEDAIILETRSGRRVSVSLVDGKLATEAAARVLPDSTQAREGLGQLPAVPQDRHGFGRKVSAQVFEDDSGKIFVEAQLPGPENVEKTVADVVQVPFIELIDDGKGGKRQVTNFRAEVRTRTYTVLEQPVPKRYWVSGNKSLSVRNAAGKMLSDDELKTALENRADVYEFTARPNPRFLESLRPETVLLVWQDDDAKAASELPAIAEQRNAADSR